MTYNSANATAKSTKENGMSIIWKDIEGTNGMYKVSECGSVLSVFKGRVCTLTDNGFGYKTVNLTRNGMDIKKGKYYIHRLVAQTFLENPDGLPQVGHRDDNKDNNHKDNLYWCSGSQNIRDAHKTNRMEKRSNHGSLNVYDDYTVEMAYRSVKMGYFGVAQAATFFGMPRTTLSSMMNKRSRTDVTDGVDLEFA